MKLNGADALIGHLKKAANIQDVREAVKLNGSEMQKKAMRIAPVDTGFMEGGIMLDLHDRGYTAVVVSTAEYSGYVEYGTRYNYAQPFIRPAFYEQEKKFIADMQRLMR